MGQAKLINGEWLTLEQAIEKHIRLVHYVVRRYFRSLHEIRIEYDDAISVGVIALARAYQKFDDSHGYRFSTYAVPRIWGEITNCVKNSSPIHFATRIKNLYLKAKNKQIDLSNPTKASKELGVTVDVVMEVKKYVDSFYMTSLSDVVFENEREKKTTIEDFLSTEEDFSSAYVRDFLDTLPNRHKMVLLMVMAGYTHVQIGREIGVGSSRVGQIVKEIRHRYIEYERGEVTA
ncbi:putative DNA-directed RNA polymerase specialized sigma subunit [Geobacillus virus E2]|uniref:RNA polymerase sigma factor n=1 Tax=Geobacillus virus E2 TaxID=447909 RepID=UPI00015367FE|nr:RNA polymerase sigma factor [Geobacillus virus E2]ABI36860.1 putative DNA-directed RNA polymerase specialized sigma subunit [Geobacillus virus E2]